MAKPGGASEKPQARKRRHMALRLCIGTMALSLVASLVLVVTIMAFTGRPITLPVWVVAEIEHRMNTAIEPAMPGASISLGGAEVMLGDDWRPRLRTRDLRLMQGRGPALLVLPELRMAFDAASIPSRQMLLQEMRITGARVNIRRDEQGRLDISLGEGSGSQITTLAEALDAIDRAFATPFLSRLKRVDADGLSVSLRDDRVGRSWQMGDGRLTLDNRADEVAADLSLSLMGQGNSATARMVAISAKNAPNARVSVNVSQVNAADIAAQAPPLSWLAAIDAPLSGDFSARLDGEGVSDMVARLEIGPGALKPSEETRPIAFSHASLSMGYDPERGRLIFNNIAVESPSLRASASGHADLVDAQGRPLTGALGGRFPAAFVTQIRFGKAMVDPVGLFERPVDFATGALDLRLQLSPFRIDVGQLSSSDDRGTRISATGQVGAGPGGWRVAMDFAINHIGRDRLLQLWPVALVDKTRSWLDKNVLNGELTDVKAALRMVPGQEPQLALSYDFAEGEVRVIPTLPMIVDGRGYATIEDSAYTMVLSQGRIVPPKGGSLDVAGSVFRVADIEQKPAIADIRLLSKGSVTAALSLLDQPPFQFLTKAGRPVELAEGQAVVDTELHLPLKPKVKLDEVGFTVKGIATNLRSDQLVPGRVVTAEQLRIDATPAGLKVSGPGHLGAVDFDMVYDQPFARESKGKSQLTGHVTLGPQVNKEFNLGLPDGLIEGKGQGQLTITLEKGKPGQLHLASDMVGIALSLPEVGWSKPAKTAAKLDLGVTLSKPPQVDHIALDAPGLSARGNIQLGDAGKTTARFERVKLDNWLDAPVELHSQGRGRPLSVQVTGGKVDLRRYHASKAAGRGGKQSGSNLLVALDRLIVNDNFAFTGFRGRFKTLGGLNGEFAGRFNGATPVTGTLVPANGGSAVRLHSEDAGAALAAANIIGSARGGSLDLQLVPRRNMQGVYDGEALIRHIGIKDAPVLAEVLNAVSVVGLLEQLNGSGIAFSEASSEFTVTPERVVITRAAAVGASMGVSMSGIYYIKTKQLDLEGVISPIYMLNVVGRIFTRPGEGLFGFNYALGGTTQKPTVSVNPLSILTPGMFRELFRNPPPRVTAAP